MKRTAAYHASGRPGRIDEEAEHYEESSSSEDELLPAPLPKTSNTRNTNLFEGELKARSQDNEDDEDEDGAAGVEADEDDGMDLLNLAGGDAAREEAIRQRIAESQEQMKHLLELFSPDQLKRYETFRRVGFPRPAIKKLILRTLELHAPTPAGSSTPATSALTAAASNVNQNLVISVSAIGKVFVGELVEEARRVMQEELGEDCEGAVQPSHLMEAQRRLRAVGLAGSSLLHRRYKNGLL